MSQGVLDASALLALLNQERGSERVAAIITDKAAISTVNFSEVVAKLSNDGMPNEMIRDLLDSLELEVIDFDTELAYQTGLLRPLTKHAGLSLGDRACLALAQHLRLLSPQIEYGRLYH
jgi:ribonuclease VapC